MFPDVELAVTITQCQGGVGGIDEGLLVARLYLQRLICLVQSFRTATDLAFAEYVAPSPPVNREGPREEFLEMERGIGQIKARFIAFEVVASPAVMRPGTEIFNDLEAFRSLHGAFIDGSRPEKQEVEDRINKLDKDVDDLLNAIREDLNVNKS